MKTSTVTIEVLKSVNDENEIQPNQYTVKKDGRIIVVTGDFVHALQCFINRCDPGVQDFAIQV